MLYDPKWEGKTETKEPSLAGFIAWLEQQEPNRGYSYQSCSECAIGQYLRSVGTNYADWCTSGDGSFSTAVKWNHMITISEPRTFGAALARARKLAAS